MSLGPRFSANKFQNVLKSALGTGATGVQKALTHIGAQKSLQSVTTVKDAKKILSKLESSGAVGDARRAREVMRKAERVASVADRMQQQQLKEQRLVELDSGRPMYKDSVVRQQAHGVSISGETNSHSVSISQSTNKPVNSTKPAAPMMATKPLLDIPFD